ncbi:MAG: ABC transporter permease [Blastocatellia bacterium]
MKQSTTNIMTAPAHSSPQLEDKRAAPRAAASGVSMLTRWHEALRVAVGAILSNQLRSGLTVTGVVVGTTVVVLVAALLEGAQSFITQETRALAPDVVRVEKANFQDFIGDAQAWALARSRRPDLTIEDVRWLRDRLSERIEIGAQLDASLPVKRGNQTLTGIAVQGVTANIAYLTNVKLTGGREFTGVDDDYRRAVVIIGADVANLLFPDQDPVGGQIYVGSLPYEVIGVAEPRGSNFGQSQDAFVRIPLNTFAKIFGLRARSLALLARARSETELSRTEVEEQMRFALGLRHRLDYGAEDDFSITTAKSVEAFASRFTNLVGFVIYPLTAIALVVGGVVVMNMMLASVSERTREIGIRMAVGARRRDVLAQFLVESTLLTLLGGLLGLLSASVIVWLAGWLTGLPVTLPWWAAGAAIFVACLTGVVFGVVPARRAARLDPIKALHAE